VAPSLLRAFLYGSHRAGTQTELLAGRALQGLAAALAVPGTLAAVDTNAAPERRGSAIGAWTGFLMLGFSIGPLLGGALTHLAGWRAVFWVNVLLMLGAIAGLATAGSAATRDDGAKRRPADRTGFVLPATFMRLSSDCMRFRAWVWRPFQPSARS
jgi:MFS family permease